MSEIMSKFPLNYQPKINKKNERKFFGILKQLAKSDDSVMNKIKVTVCKGEIIEEKEKIFIAPSKFMSCHKHSVTNNSNENKNKIIIENLNIKEINSSPHYIEEVDYPDSSDLSDDDV